MHAFMAGAKEVNPEGPVLRHVHRLLVRSAEGQGSGLRDDREGRRRHVRRALRRVRCGQGAQGARDRQRDRHPGAVPGHGRGLARCGTWSRRSTRALEGREGGQVQARGLRPVLDDEAQGSRARRSTARSTPKVPKDLPAKVGARRRTSSTASSRCRSSRPSPSRPRSNPRCVARARAPRGDMRVPTHLDSRWPTRSSGSPASPSASARSSRTTPSRSTLARGRGARAARRERRRQVDAGLDPVRPLRRRRRHDRGVRRAAAAGRSRRGARRGHRHGPPALRRWPTTCRCSTT